MVGMRIAFVMLSTAGLIGCNQGANEPQTSSAARSVPESSSPSPVQRLPVSLNDVMVAIVNEAADPLWLAAWRNPATDKEWRALERRAVQLEIAGALLAIPGTGPNDDTWVGNPAWRRWSVALREAGARAAAAAEARDLQDVAASGDEIVEVCEGCHGTFKPDLPTGGKYGELSPTSIDFEDDEE